MPLIMRALVFFILAAARRSIAAPRAAPRAAQIVVRRPGRPEAEPLESGGGSVVIAGNSTISSQNRAFDLGFFTVDGGRGWFLGIWYASIPAPTYVWVANRENPATNLTGATAEIDAAGRLRVVDLRDSGKHEVWRTGNGEKGKELRLMNSGDLVLVSDGGAVVWRSFDFPGDTFLPGMSIRAGQSITCWRSPSDPAPGRYSLRLRPPLFGEIELVHNLTNRYWSTGNWTGTTFAGIPEMTVKYIYSFRFDKPFTPDASFGYTEVATLAENGLTRPPFTRFCVDPSGRLRQFTWSSQTQSWNMFWWQPEIQCRVYGLCGGFGFCDRSPRGPCACADGFVPVDGDGWLSGDYSRGCRRDGDGDACNSGDRFDEIGAVRFDGTEVSVLSSGTMSGCKMSCLANCSCVGFFHNSMTNLCRNLHGALLNLRSPDPGYPDGGDGFYLRVQKGASMKKKAKLRDVALISSIAGSVLVLGFLAGLFLFLRKRVRRRKKGGSEESFSGANLKVFSYRDLESATREFSETLGHGGFGAVFRGNLSDSSAVAVKRLERPTGGGEREFRAEVGIIGNIQHVNLIRLRGFCSESSHRLLVYDYMPNGPLSSYLRPRDGGSLSWEVRFMVAVGTARGIAYLHEECRERIIHCDIKPENILLDADFTPRVSDFGLAKLVGRDFSRVLVTMRGTWGYVAPEWISGVAITPKADVYSYGMTLLELLGGRRNVEPSPGRGGEEGWFFPPWAARRIIEGNLAAVVDERLGAAYCAAEAGRVGLVAVWCIQDEEDARPAMGAVVKMLEGAVEVGVPPPPKLIQALVSGESFRGVRVDSGDSQSTGGAGPVGGAQVSGSSHLSIGNGSGDNVAADLNN